MASTADDISAIRAKLGDAFNNAMQALHGCLSEVETGIVREDIRVLQQHLADFAERADERQCAARCPGFGHIRCELPAATAHAVHRATSARGVETTWGQARRVR